VIAGESAGLIHDVRPAKDIVRDVVREMREVFSEFATQEKGELSTVA
jgi:hypothetical protein